MDVVRRRARELCRAALDRGEPVAWFDELYREAEEGRAVVPWADLRPNPHIVAWLDAHPVAIASNKPRVLDVGGGLGDDAEELARRGFTVTSFDVAETAVRRARARFAESCVTREVANLLSPPAHFARGFDLVVEAYTLQVLPPAERARAAVQLVDFVAPEGGLLVIARGRDPGDDPGAMPWPLLREEVESLAQGGLVLRTFEDFLDDEEPASPVRRFRAFFQRASEEDAQRT